MSVPSEPPLHYKGQELYWNDISYHVVQGGSKGGGTGESQGAVGITREDWRVWAVSRLPALRELSPPS